MAFIEKIIIAIINSSKLNFSNKVKIYLNNNFNLNQSGAWYAEAAIKCDKIKRSWV